MASIPEEIQGSANDATAKETDKRYKSYVAEYGKKCWELDALEPAVIVDLIEDSVARYTNEVKRQELIDLEIEQKKSLAFISEHWQTLNENKKQN